MVTPVSCNARTSLSFKKLSSLFSALNGNGNGNGGYGSYGTSVGEEIGGNVGNGGNVGTNTASVISEDNSAALQYLRLKKRIFRPTLETITETVPRRGKG